MMRLAAAILVVILVVQGGCQSVHSIPAMQLSNWRDMIVSWAYTRDNLNEAPWRPIGVNGLRQSRRWDLNTVDSDTFALIYDGVKYTDPSKWDGNSYLRDDGVWQTEFTTYNGATLPFQLIMEVIVPPHNQHYVIRYRLTPTGSSKKWELLSYLCTTPSSGSAKSWGWRDDTTGQFMVDGVKNDGQYFTSAALKSVQGFQMSSVGDSKDPLTQFASKGVAGLGSTTVSEAVSVAIGLGFTGSGSFDIGLVRGLGSSYDTARAIGTAASAESAAYWVEDTNLSVTRWLSQARGPVWEDSFYRTSLLFLKHAQNPTIGTIVASFHVDYEFKVWTRDATYAAAILDAAGFSREAEMFLGWLAKAELVDGGYFHTCYSFWTGGAIGFVEPQLDSAGLMITASLYHVALAKLVDATARADAIAFIKQNDLVLGRIKAVDAYFQSHQSSHGFVPPDYSIWEESSSPVDGSGYPTGYYTFTQIQSWAGLRSAGRIYADLLGDSAAAKKSRDRADSLKSGILTHLWMEQEGFFARQMWSDSLTLDKRADGSTSNAVWTGLLDKADTRAERHMEALTSRLTRDTWGMARYEGDIYFYASMWNPGGQESSEEMPAWPLVGCFHSWSEDQATRQSRLNWCKERAAWGGMPVGEAVDPVIDEFIWSSSPDIYEHAGVYVWTVLIDKQLVPIPAPDALNV